MPSSLLGELLSLQSSVKMMHWTTKSYAQHEALDNLYGIINSKGDELVESLMGMFKLPAIVQVSASGDKTFANWSKAGKSVPETLQAMHDHLVQIRGMLPDETSKSIMDDIIVAFRVAKFVCSMSK